MYKKWYLKKVDQVEMAVITPHYSLLLLLIIIIILTPHSLQYEKVKIIKKYRVKKRKDDYSIYNLALHLWFLKWESKNATGEIGELGKSLAVGKGFVSEFPTMGWPRRTRRGPGTPPQGCSGAHPGLTLRPPHTGGR